MTTAGFTTKFWTAHNSVVTAAIIQVLQSAMTAPLYRYPEIKPDSGASLVTFNYEYPLLP